MSLCHKAGFIALSLTSTHVKKKNDGQIEEKLTFFLMYKSTCFYKSNFGMCPLSIEAISLSAYIFTVVV